MPTSPQVRSRDSKTDPMNYGGAILFVSLLASGGIVIPWVFAYAAHCFLVIVEQTGAGSDRVVWPDEPFLDWLWKGFYLAWLLTVLVLPAWLLTRLLAPALFESLGLALFLCTLLLWLVFPICFLSSQSAGNPWLILHQGILVRLAQCGRELGLFYLTTVLLLGCFAACLHFALAGWLEMEPLAAGTGVSWLPTLLSLWSWLFVMPLTAMVAAATLFIYARLLGRLARALGQVDVNLPAPDPKKPASQASQPAPEEPAAAPKPPVETYALAEEITVPPKALPPDAHAGNGFGSGAQPPRPKPNKQIEGEKILPLSQLVGRRVFLFPWYRTSWKAWTWMALDALVAVLLGRLLVTTWPF